MKMNMGSIDRILRFIVGIGILGAGIYYQSWWGAIGLVLIGTSSVGWCPAYLPFKISTRKSES